MDSLMPGHVRWQDSPRVVPLSGHVHWRVGVLVGVAALHLSLAMALSGLHGEPVRTLGARTLSVGMLPMAAPVRDSHTRHVSPAPEPSTPRNSKAQQPKPVTPRHELPVIARRSLQGESKLVTRKPPKMPLPSRVEPKPATAVTAASAPSAPAQPSASQGAQSASRSEARFDADYLNNPRPAYPPFSLRLREEGRVLLKVLVNRAGQANSVSIAQSSGYARLDNSALETVRHWRFVPAKVGEEPQDSWVIVPINFSLRENV